MRLVPALALLALAGQGGLSAASIIERQEPHDIEYTDLLVQPQAFQGMRVRFRATFVETASIFDTFHTGFTAERFLNVVVWDDQDRIWEPEVRAGATATLYFRKDRADARALSSMAKYSQVEVVGEVVSALRSMPWINIHTVTPLPNLGAFTDNAIWHLTEARSLADEDRRELAEEHYVAALRDQLPDPARVAIAEIRAANLLAADRFREAAEVVREATDLAARTPTIDPQLAPRLDYLRARALAELAERGAPDAKALFAQSVTHAESAILADPSVADAYSVLGIALAGLERFDEAKLQCARAIRMQPENAEIRWYLGRILDRQGDYNQAIEVLKRGIDLAPKDYRLHKAIAKAYHNRAKLGGASAAEDLVTSLREYDISIRLEATDPDLYYWSGVVLEDATAADITVRIGQEMVKATYDLAIERFRACLAVDDQYVDAHLRLITRFRHAERPDEAASHYNGAIALLPDRGDLYAEQGAYLWELGRREEAKAVYAAWHARAPRDVNTLYALGRLEFELGNREPAVAWLRQLLQVERGHAKGNSDLTELLVELGDARTALNHATTALAGLQDPAWIERTRRFQGLAHYALDDLDATQTVLADVVAGASDIRLPLALGWSLSRQASNAARVTELAQQAIAIQADNASAAELLGWSQYLAGDFANAEKTLTAVTFEDSAVRGWRLGLTLFNLGSERYAEAKPLLEAGRGLSSRKRIHAPARNESDRALREIVRWERDQERQRVQREREEREAARQRERAEREAARRAPKPE